jgi:hypothetical protein
MATMRLGKKTVAAALGKDLGSFSFCLPVRRACGTLAAPSPLERPEPAVQRGRKERKDSVTEQILFQREAHLARLADVEVAPEALRAITALGLGDRRRRRGVYALISNSKKTAVAMAAARLRAEGKATLTGAGGFALHLTSSSGEMTAAAKKKAAAQGTKPDAAGNWPLFVHLLPEIAFAGHSNAGKSTLTNAVSGLLPRKGPASVSDRAGWTDQICFFKVNQ